MTHTEAIKEKEEEEVSADISNVIYPTFLLIYMTCEPLIPPKRPKRLRFNMLLLF